MVFSKRLRCVFRLFAFSFCTLTFTGASALAVSPGIAASTTASVEADTSLSAAAITPADDAWRAKLPSDPDAATEAYLARIPPAARARADAYFEGGYWLQLWNYLLGLVIAFFLLGSGIAARARNRIDAVTSRPFARTFLFAVVYTAATWVLSLPLTLYADFFREHRYGLSNLTFPAWFREEMIGLSLSILFGSLVIALIYAAVRKFPRTWHGWGAAISILFVILMIAIAPVFLSPLFNHYKSLEAGPVRDSILSLARANGIPATDVYEFDASKQSNRVSANVSGFLGTTRISLNDNLLRRSSLAEIRGVVGHEMGHYVMHHVFKSIVEFAILLFLGFVFIRSMYERVIARYGSRWGVHGIGDVAGLPLVAALLSTYFFVLTPVNNSLVRQQESEADLFGINTAREPDGEAEVDLKLTEYRKADPGALEEIIFFDHPATRARIHMAMQWKAENLGGKPVDH